jgi:hypothetical protein
MGPSRLKLGCAFSPMGSFRIKIFFPFPYAGFIPNFGNSYLFEYLSNIHETNSVGLLNSVSIHENIKLNSRTGVEWFKAKSHSNSFIKSSSHVGTVAVKVFARGEGHCREASGTTL